ncbi:Excalibur calcium-binding domain-containing protein [Fictibacillus enclensis]|uniref:Excalibur calcium-binding domain-containing protein n=1 Tax=Fictibacillus enclensis TaxID=1017270 RepID=A0A0V8J269_9BACL|nr:excalibur calcium-binding domain-containing protein [Fictibacillus enclensis]KSU81119.1 hypothetical protein AS030_19455 [Fictibacillus enclensis]SCC35265.1 Excalibur calcium-binding domain-containing protein [Fictibacillus enclensis]
MEKWIGNLPTLAQKSFHAKYKDILSHSFYTTFSDSEVILKAIEAECDKSSGREIKGVLIATNKSIHFLSKKEQFTIEYEVISDITIKPDGKNKNEMQLTLLIGFNERNFDDIKKDNDSQEFFEIIEKKVINPNQELQTTVTHNFDYFLHAEKLNELRQNNVQCTAFLMKRDDKGFSSNGKRLLSELHPKAILIEEAFYYDKEKQGNFIVVDKFVWLYEYKDKERVAKKIIYWPFAFFNNAAIDHFALKSDIITNEGKLTLKAAGKKFISLLSDEGVTFSLKSRKWYNKVLGFRSKKWWKMTIASLTYGFVLLIVLAMVFGEDTTETSATTKSDNHTAVKDKDKATKDSKIDKEKQEKKKAMLAEEKRKEEKAALLAKEQRKKEEAARLAKEQRKKEEAARLAEEQRKKEEAARLAQQQRDKAQAAKAAAANQAKASVFYKNCSAARAAGAAPIHRGEPGYAKHLDRDGDGIGCDS